MPSGRVMAKIVPSRATIRPRGEVWRVSDRGPSSPSCGKSSSGLNRTCQPDDPWPRSSDRCRLTAPSRSVENPRSTGTAMACTGPTVTAWSGTDGPPLELPGEPDALGVVEGLGLPEAPVDGEGVGDSP